jgi:long-subunit fatty acid transport protein
MPSLRTAVALSALLLATVPSSADAGGFHITIMGVRRTSMFAIVSNPDDATALFNNPAGLADQKGTQLHLSSGLTLLSSHFQLKELDPQRFPDINPNCGDPRSPTSTCPWTVGSDGYYNTRVGPERYFGAIPYLGISQDLGEISPSLKNLTASFALYAPGAYGASFAVNAPTAYYVINGLFVIVAATGGVGWRINDYISVGASFSYNYRRLDFAQRFSTIDLLTPSNIEPLNNPDITPALAQAALGDLRLDYSGSDNGIGWGAGMLIRPAGWMSIGLAYTGFTDADFMGNVQLQAFGSRATGTMPSSPATLRMVTQGFGIKLPTKLEVQMPIPPTFLAGMSFFPTAGLEIAVESRLYLYTLYKRQLIRPIYDANETGTEPITVDTLSKDKHYSNSMEFSLGVKVEPFESIPDLEIMGGVQFDKSPTPDQTFSIDNPSFNQLVFGLGVRKQLGGWRLGFAYLLDFYLPRDITDSKTSPPTDLRGSGHTQIPTIEAEYTF